MRRKRLYNAVNGAIVKALQDIAGQENVLVDAEALEPYTHDEVVDLRADPEVVVRIRSAEQVAEVFKLAQRERIPVTPRGAGYGLSGGAVPVHGGIVLSTEKMNRILEIDKENLMVTVEPGVITGDLHRAVEEEGLFYPPDPASLDSCTIGGNIAEGAGGPRAVKYGVTQDYVRGLEAVLPSGEIVHMGGKRVKDVTGYNLIQLLIGSDCWCLSTTLAQRPRPCPTLSSAASYPLPSSSWSRTACWLWSGFGAGNCPSARRRPNCSSRLTATFRKLWTPNTRPWPRCA
jgi:glycolate oxidase